MTDLIEEGNGLDLLRPHPRVSDDASVSYRAKQIRALFDTLAAQAAEIERLTKERDERNALAIRRAGEKATAEARADALAARVAELEERDKVLTGIMANVPDRMVLMGTGQVAERNSDGSVCVSNTQWLLGTVYELAGVLCRARAALQGAAPAGEGGGS